MTATEIADTTTDAPGGARRKPAHAEFIQIWEEGYISTRIAHETMHIPSNFIVDGAALRLPDGTLDRVRILAYIEGVFAATATYRLRLKRSFLGLTPPAWVPDDQFDLSRHVIFSDEIVDLATADLRHLGGQDDGLMSLDHPLWRVRITELVDGRVAIGMISHHAVADGLSGMKLSASLFHKKPDDPIPAPSDPFADRRAPGTVELPWLALRQWWARQPSLGAAWKAYWAKPFIRRVRRVGARMLIPLRYGRGGESARAAALPPRFSSYRVMPAAQANGRARAFGGTLSDLLLAAMVGAWNGPEREVRARFPVSYHNPNEPHIRNHVRDMEISANADDDLRTTMATIRAQVDARDEPRPDGWTPPGTPIGYSTLLPWVTRTAYFCGAPVVAVTPFPASVGADRLAAAGMLYDGSLFIGATMQVESDVDRVVGRMYEIMSGEPDSGRP
jgi:diacylglycerol O-acyltransferase